MTVDKSALCEYTPVPDVFINIYLGNADGDHVRVYLYLLKNASDPSASDPLSIASALHISQEKVIEALMTWEKEGLLELKTTDGAINAIKFLNPASAAAAKTKHQITAGRLKQLRRDDTDAGQLIFVAEEYFGRGLSPSEAKTLLYFYDNAGFSSELCDYLIEYCASMMDNRSRDFSGYMNKVAVSWSENGISTAAQAKADSPIRSKDAPRHEKPAPSAHTGKSKFSDFASHDYDFDELTKRAKQK